MNNIHLPWLLVTTNILTNCLSESSDFAFDKVAPPLVDFIDALFIIIDCNQLIRAELLYYGVDVSAHTGAKLNSLIQVCHEALLSHDLVQVLENLI